MEDVHLHWESEEKVKYKYILFYKLTESFECSDSSFRSSSPMIFLQFNIVTWRCIWGHLDQKEAIQELLLLVYS